MTISVFLADDHGVLRDGLQHLLDVEPDIEVVGGAADGREAVRLVAELCPDVVVMDIVMPELNGIEATRNIHKNCPDVQVIMLSMHGTKEHVFRSIQAGARGFLLKGSAGNEVVAAVRSVHAGHTFLTPKISDQVFGEYGRLGDHDETSTLLSRLSSREREVLQLVVEGKSSAEIAKVLSISVKTVDTYRSRLMRKLEIRDLPALVKFAIQHGLTPLE